MLVRVLDPTISVAVPLLSSSFQYDTGLDEILEVEIVVTMVCASSPSNDELKYGDDPYIFCIPVLLSRSMYGIESDHPYPTSLSWLVFWLL